MPESKKWIFQYTLIGCDLPCFRYVPSLAYEIFSMNTGLLYINLQGIAIGNGWVHPIVQNKAYVDYSYNLGT
jgi:carboxypeptidase C (cathepsin A)